MPNAGQQLRLPEVRYVAGELKPPLKWAGGKRWLVPTLEPIWQEHRARRLVEPFCGGLSVTLGLSPRRALLNDINPHLMAFYGWLKRGLRIELPLDNDESLYYQYRQRFNELLATGRSEEADAAALFYFLNRTGYNGLCRFNKKGEFNVPFGQYKTINYTRDFSDYRPVFAEWELTNVDVEELPIEQDDFLYADPPYDVEFTEYSKGGFGWEDQIRAAEWLAKHPGPVVLSNQATERIMELYDKLGFELRYLEAPRMISCTGDRTPAREVLATKNLTLTV